MPAAEKPTPEQMQKMLEEMRKKENEGLTPEEIREKDRKKEEQKRKNVATLEETLQICRAGTYRSDGRTVPVGVNEEALSEILVFLPDEIDAQPVSSVEMQCEYSCANRDALSLAREKSLDPAYRIDADHSEGVSPENRILVLNLASATRPGGAIRDGANGQEEDLCRKSSLLLSLESESAKRYYDYNNALDTHLGSDAVMISPQVAVVRDERGVLLPQPFYISVLSCSAPMVRFGFEGKTEEEYKALLEKRIEGMLKCAGAVGYKNLVLGAFGCGVFGNDAAVVSDAFRKVLSGPIGNGFSHVDFAVLCTPGKEYNYTEFCRNFPCQ